MIQFRKCSIARCRRTIWNSNWVWNMNYLNLINLLYVIELLIYVLRVGKHEGGWLKDSVSTERVGNTFHFVCQQKQDYNTPPLTNFWKKEKKNFDHVKWTSRFDMLHFSSWFRAECDGPISNYSKLQRLVHNEIAKLDIADQQRNANINLTFILAKIWLEPDLKQSTRLTTDDRQQMI